MNTAHPRPSWSQTTLSSVCEKITDGSHNPPKKQSTGLPMLSAKNVKERGLDFSADFRLISKEDFEQESKRTQIEAGDVLLTIVGALGRTAVVEESHLPLTLQRSVAVLKPSNAINSKYLCYALETPEVQSFISQNAKGTAQKGIYLKTIGAISIPLAPLKEQRRIADKLDTTLAVIEDCERKLNNAAETIQRFRQSVLAAAVSGELTREWREERGIGKDSWQHLRLRDVGEFGRGKSKHRPRNDPRLFGGDYPFIQTGEVANSEEIITEHKKTLSEFGLKQSKLWPEGTLCITIAANIADTAILGYPACFPDSVVGFIADQKKAKTKYIKWLIGSIAGDLERFAPATAQKNINLTILDEIVLAIPSVDEQDAAVAQGQKLFDCAKDIEGKISAALGLTTLIKRSLLAKAFRGELVPQDPSEDPASTLLERIKDQRRRDAEEKKSAKKIRKARSIG